MLRRLRCCGGARKTAEGNASPRPRPPAVVPFKALFRYADRWDKVNYVAGLLAAVVSGAARPLVQVFIGSVFTALAQVPFDAAKVNSISLNFLYIASGLLVGGWMQQSCFKIAGMRQVRLLRQRLVSAALDQEIAYYEGAASAAHLMQCINEDCTTVQRAISEKLGWALMSLATSISGIIMAFIYGWSMELVMLSIFILMFFVGFLVRIKINQAMAASNEGLSVSRAFVRAATANVRTVHSCNAGERNIAKYEELLEAQQKTGIRTSWWLGLAQGSIEFLTYANMALGLWYGGQLVISGEFTSGGQVFQVLGTSLIGGASLGKVVPLLKDFAAAQSAGHRLFEVIDRKPGIDKDAGTEAELVEGELELSSVDFSYPSAPEKPVLCSLSLVIPAGTRTALVGGSGSGKSTVAGLLLRFYDPLAGAVLLDGTDIRTLNLRWLRQQVGIVSQEPVLFASSVAENIGCGREGASLEEVVAAAKAANAHKFIEELPHGYSTQVGENGIQMSGGQKQRLAIARAILRNPKILILDEATSALDSSSERVVQAALDNASGGRTTVTIAHRLSTVVNSDMIVVMEMGEVVERGSHDELLAQKGLYASMVGRQTLEDVEEEEQEEAAEEQPPVLRIDTSLRSASARQMAGETPTPLLFQATLTSTSIVGSTADAANIASALSNVTSMMRAAVSSKRSVPDEGLDSIGQVGLERSKSMDVPRGSSLWRTMVIIRRWKWMMLAGLLGAAVLGAATPGMGISLSLLVNSLSAPCQTVVVSSGQIAEIASLASNPSAEVAAYQEMYAELASLPYCVAINDTIYASPANATVAAGLPPSAPECPCNPGIQSAIRKYCLVFVGIAVGALIGGTLRGYCFGYLGQVLAGRLRHSMFHSLMRQEIGWFDREENNSAAIVNRLSADATAVKGPAADSIGLVVQNLSTIVTGMAIAFAYSWIMTLAAMACVPILCAATWYTTHMAAISAKREEAAVSAANVVASEGVLHIRVVAALGLEGRLERQYAAATDSVIKPLTRLAVYEGIGYGLSLFAIASYGLAFYIGGLLLSRGDITSVQITTPILGIFLVALGLWEAQNQFPDVSSGKAAMARVFELIDRPPRIDNLSAEGLEPEGCDGDIELRGVTFAYPQRPAVRVFRNFSLAVPAGKSAALVGESGSGKSTIISLLERFYDPLSGAVLLDHLDIRTLSLRWLRDHIGLVGQEPVLFNVTVAENIRYGRPGASDKEVEAAARAANAADFIGGLPRGLGTLLGEGGVQLSGGQKQRVAIARALIKDPRVLLLDEATSALDPESERVVQEALDRLAAGRTTVVVAHRLSTVRDCDAICVVSRGAIVERGTHAELMALPQGHYQHLVQQQQGR